MSPCSHLRFRAPLERAVLLIFLAVLSGCDVPTALPIFDVRWVIPVEETSISVDELLPTDVTVVGGNFEVTNVADVMLSQTLDVLCPDCIPFNGLTVDKPLFNLVYNQSGSLPADLVSVELVSASISLAMQNDLGFDPIRPAVAAPGTMTITIHAVDATGPELGRVVLDGNVATDSVPDGALTTVSLPLQPGTLTSTFVAVVDVFSPLGDPLLIDITSSFDITVTVGTVLVSSATLDVDGLAVNLDPTPLDAEGIDSTAVNRIQSGSLILDIQNPFGVGVDSLSLGISGPFPSSPIQKILSIGSGATSSVTLMYTATELQSFLGQSGVQITGAGTVVSPGGPATVTPTDEVVIEATLDIVLEIS